MGVTISMDPGIRGCGVSIWIGDKVAAATYVKNTQTSGNGPRECATMAAAVHRWIDKDFDKPTMLILEWPQIYVSRIREGKMQEDPNDLLSLCGVDAALSGLFLDVPVTHYLPNFWKGNMDGDVMVERIKGRLHPDEKDRVELPSAKGLGHNVWDAIGIGLKYHDRLERKRVYARE